MAGRRFQRQLEQLLPEWAEKGWISPGAEAQILAHAAGRPATHRFGYAVGILGVVLLGAGVITFFAANWDQMAKLTKLLLLFGSLWLSYGAAAYLRSAAALPKLGEAVLLLGVILFGANVMLIAQIYHVDAHYPDGILMWAVGGLLTAWALRSQAAMIAALVLGILWTLVEGFERYGDVHWAYLAFAAVAAVLVERRGWSRAAHLWCIGLMLWAVTVYDMRDLVSRDAVYLTQCFLLVALGLYLLATLPASARRAPTLAEPVRRYAVLGGLITLFMLTIPDLQRGGGWLEAGEALPAPNPAWPPLTLALAAVPAVLAALRWRSAAVRPHARWGLLLLATLLALVIANLVLDGDQAGLAAFGFNLVFFAGLVWLVFVGLEQRDPLLLNLAFGFFTLGLIARYFDTFWTLMDRSLFFMAGGAALLIGGYVLERQRRRLAQRIADGRGEGTP